jgi:glutathione S-transferase
MQIYGSAKTRTFRPLWALEECQLTYDHIPIDPKTGEHRQGELRQRIKTGKVPYLVDGNLELFESAAICLYIARIADRQDLWPSQNPGQEALAQQWLSFAQQELDPYLWLSTLHGKFLPESQRIAQIPPYCLSYLQRSLVTLEQGLGHNSYLLGETFSLADIMVGHCLLWTRMIAKDLLSESLVQYLQRLRERPAFVKTTDLP